MVRFSLWQRARAFISRLRESESAVAMVEFAYALPILTTLAFTGLELAYFGIVHQRVSQIATMTADNAARLRTPMTEAFVNQLFVGVTKAGDPIDFTENGRIILSSVQNAAAGANQWIRWQRCVGTTDAQPASAFGPEDPAGNQAPPIPVGDLTIPAGTAIMMVEAAYDYEPLLFPQYFMGEKHIAYESAFIVRQRTDFSISGVKIANCPS